MAERTLFYFLLGISREFSPGHHGSGVKLSPGQCRCGARPNILVYP